MAEVAPRLNEYSSREDPASGENGLGLEHRKARLAAGYDADLLAVEGDPTTDITALLRPVQVFRHGRPLHHAAPSASPRRPSPTEIQP